MLFTFTKTISINFILWRSKYITSISIPVPICRLMYVSVIYFFNHNIQVHACTHTHTHTHTHSVTHLNSGNNSCSRQGKARQKKKSPQPLTQQALGWGLIVSVFSKEINCKHSVKHMICQGTQKKNTPAIRSSISLWLCTVAKCKKNSPTLHANLLAAMHIMLHWIS